MLIFVLMRLAPGNITDMIFESAGYVDEADRHRLEAELGIDKPRAGPVRACGSATSCAATSASRTATTCPRGEIIKPRLPVTLELAVLALGFSVLLGVPAA